MFAEQRTTTGWQIVLLAANAFGSAIKSIYCPLPKSPCYPSVRQSIRLSILPTLRPSSFFPPLVGEAWGFCVCKITKLLPQPHAARTIYLIHIQISDNARSPPLPLALPLSPPPPSGSWVSLWRLSDATLATFVCGSDLFLLNCKKLAALVWWQISSSVYRPRRATHDASAAPGCQLCK